MDFSSIKELSVEVPSTYWICLLWQLLSSHLSSREYLFGIKYNSLVPDRVIVYSIL